MITLAKEQSGDIAVAFRYSPTLVEQVKRVPGRRWNPDRKLWTVPVASLPVLVKVFGDNYTVAGEIPELEILQKTVDVTDIPTTPVEPFEFKTDPFDHQVVGWNFGITRDTMLLADDMGLGKTKQVIDIAEHRANKGEVKRVLIVAKATLKYNWSQEIGIHGHREAVVVDGNTPTKKLECWRESHERNVFYTIINYEQMREASVVRKQIKAGERVSASDLLGFEIAESNWDMVVLDECLVEGTMIDTPRGKRAIESLNIGDEVLGFNHETGGIEVTKVLHTFRRCTNSPLHDVNGATMTGNHPVWTETRGYIPAEKIVDVDIVKRIVSCPYTMEVVQDAHAEVRMVRKGVSDEAIICKFREDETLLWDKLLCEVEDVSDRNPGPSIHRGTECQAEGEHETKLGREPEVYRGASGVPNVGQEPIQGPRGASEGTGCPKKNGLLDAEWGEWYRTDRASENTSRLTRVGNGIHSITRETSEGVPDPLQNRHSQSTSDDSYRGRWELAPVQTGTGTRCEKGQQATGTRMGSAEVYESGDTNGRGPDCAEVKVYNIETGTGNYFANGLLVHNCHKIKNHKSRMGKAVQDLRAPYKYALTGTPIINRPEELFNLLKWFGMERRGYWSFIKEYCVLGGFTGWQIEGYKDGAVKQMSDSLRSIMLRRLKMDAVDIPEKMRRTVWVEMPPAQRRVYNQILKELRTELMDQNGNSIGGKMIALTKILRLKQAAGSLELLGGKPVSAKIDTAKELVEEMVEAGQKVLIFTQFLGMYHALKRELDEYGVVGIDGSMKPEDRMSAVNRFQSDAGTQVFVGMAQACREGLTLTAAQNVIFVDLEWAPAYVAQAEDRAHRIGQKNQVLITKVLAKNSIDEAIEKLLEEKQSVFDAVVEGEGAEDMAGSLIATLLAQ